MRIRFAIAAAVVFAGTAASVSAADFPARRAGLWQTTMYMDQRGMGPMNTKMCLDADTDAKMMKYGMSHQGSDCSPPSIGGFGGSRSVDIVCHMEGSTQKSHVTIAYSGDAYHMDMQTVFSPALRGQSKMHMTQDAKWMGSCPAGMKPGDMQMPGGYTVNVVNAMENPAAAPGGNPYGHLTREQIQAIMKAHGGH